MDFFDSTQETQPFVEIGLCINVCIHVAYAFDAAAGAANGLKAQRARVRETGTLTLHGEQTDLSL